MLYTRKCISHPFVTEIRGLNDAHPEKQQPLQIPRKFRIKEALIRPSYSYLKTTESQGYVQVREKFHGAILRN